jgi:hypothetical protein
VEILILLWGDRNIPEIKHMQQIIDELLFGGGELHFLVYGRDHLLIFLLLLF